MNKTGISTEQLLFEHTFRQAENTIKRDEERLYHCNATVFTSPLVDNVIFLQSYKTVVALYDIENNTIYQRGRYSHTTYQHFRKFRNFCWENYCDPRKISVLDIKEINLELYNWFR